MVAVSGGFPRTFGIKEEGEVKEVVTWACRPDPISDVFSCEVVVMASTVAGVDSNGDVSSNKYGPTSLVPLKLTRGAQLLSMSLSCVLVAKTRTMLISPSAEGLGVCRAVADVYSSLGLAKGGRVDSMQGVSVSEANAKLLSSTDRLLNIMDLAGTGKIQDGRFTSAQRKNLKLTMSAMGGSAARMREVLDVEMLLPDETTVVTENLIGQGKLNAPRSQNPRVDELAQGVDRSTSKAELWLKSAMANSPLMVMTGKGGLWWGQEKRYPNQRGMVKGLNLPSGVSYDDIMKEPPLSKTQAAMIGRDGAKRVYRSNMVKEEELLYYAGFRVRAIGTTTSVRMTTSHEQPIHVNGNRRAQDTHEDGEDGEGGDEH